MEMAPEEERGTEIDLKERWAKFLVAFAAVPQVLEAQQRETVS